MTSKTPSNQFFFCNTEFFFVLALWRVVSHFVCQSIEEKDHLTVLLLLDKHFEIGEFGFPTTELCEHCGSKAYPREITCHILTDK